MKKTKVSLLTKEGKLSHLIKVETHDDTFHIPVLDVRDGERERAEVDAMVKSRNISRGSQFFKPSFSVLGFSYNHSAKK